MSSPSQKRMDQVIRLLNDKEIELTPREVLSLAYHAIAFEYLDWRLSTLDRRQKKHGDKVKAHMTLANFKHQLNKI